MTGAIAGLASTKIVSFVNPYPFHRAQIGSLLRDYLLKEKRDDIIQAYGLEAFDVNVLDIRRTATEKRGSLFRHSLAEDYPSELRARIRHFYDPHYLWQDTGCREYLQTNEFRKDFDSLVSEDQARFDEPIGWQNRVLTDSQPEFIGGIALSRCDKRPFYRTKSGRTIRTDRTCPIHFPSARWSTCCTVADKDLAIRE